MVLVEPEIPNNTGNVGRTCVATETSLTLIKPMGFEITDAKLKRAGLDYWQHLQWSTLDSIQELPAGRKVYFSAHAKHSIYDFQFKEGDFLVFGKESKGLSPELIRDNEETSVFIPTPGLVRSLNMATAVAVSVYEALRQIRYSKT
ncbi:MAG: tRNA (cytidine(34)-2'-O)-methyltransferase [Bdellovibrionaceae bacterium]|nr:tRNA (cytidine(34)-2'-O)-methyltransferase [Pseudobdellovibrionaceae bacterium]